MAYDPTNSVGRPLLALTNDRDVSLYPTHTSKNASFLRFLRRPRVIALSVSVFLIIAATYTYFAPLSLPRTLPGFGSKSQQDGTHPAAPAPHSDPYAIEHRPPPPVDPAYPLSVFNTLSNAMSRYTLLTSRPPPLHYSKFHTYAQEHKCFTDPRAYAGVFADFAPFWAAERREERRTGKRGWFREQVTKTAERWVRDGDSHGAVAMDVRSGRMYRPGYQGSYFDGDWDNKINMFASSLPDMKVLINGRDEPRVAYDTAPLLRGSKSEVNLGIVDGKPFAHSFDGSAPASDFFRTREGCAPLNGEMGDVPFLVSPSSSDLTTDLIPILSMAKLADGSGIGSGAALDFSPSSGHSCFADILIVGEFYYTSSSWAGKFEFSDNVPWDKKREVIYWRGKSNGGHIRGQNYRFFPRFRLMDIAREPENKHLFDVQITEWHEWHCTDNCDADAIRKEYNITGQKAPREESYKYKYVLDVDGNSFSGRYLGLLRSGSLVFKSTAFAEYFTPWLIPYEHFIPVRPDLSDLAAKIAWAQKNDKEAHRIQESGRRFAEDVLTGAQNDCYWFAVMLEWGELWGSAEV
ncbi:unnamed protein product [Mycena citricolor]|uniref:Glycosyl transferase CAP10 domain-containing protein n=1 Tax=Mycena citricolor TaxID=2018698 RepID=A0AAD2HG54_9AGAR|nr:unnamed protein product [Mycena citricolor]